MRTGRIYRRVGYLRCYLIKFLPWLSDFDFSIRLFSTVGKVPYEKKRSTKYEKYEVGSFEKRKIAWRQISTVALESKLVQFHNLAILPKISNIKNIFEVQNYQRSLERWISVKLQYQKVTWPQITNISPHVIDAKTM